MSSGGGENKPNLQIIGQYIKDLSFENPGAPTVLGANPEMDLGVDLQAKPAGPDLYEVVLSMRVRANADDKPLFILELAYAALVRMQNIPEEAGQRMLLIQTPYLMFPFARRVMADLVRDGGMPPLMIEPIDFASLYQAKMAQRGPQPPPPAPVNRLTPDSRSRLRPVLFRQRPGAARSLPVTGAAPAGAGADARG